MADTSITTGSARLMSPDEHEKNFKGVAPHTKRVGIDTILGVVKSMLKKSLGNNTLIRNTFVGDIAINALYNTFATAPTRNQALVRGALLGLGVGLGATLIDRFQDRDKSKNFFEEKGGALTLYVVGGLAIAALVNYLESQKVTKLPPM